jgi:hypothetical protein
MQLAIDPGQFAADPGVGAVGAAAEHRLKGSVETQLEAMVMEVTPHGAGHTKLIVQGY